MEILKLKEIEVGDFRRSERTLFEAKKRNLKPGEVVCFISGRGDQVLFVFALTIISGRPVLTSRKHRLYSGIFSGDMLAEYGRAENIRLIGIPRFTEIQERRRLEKLKQRRAA